MIRRLTLTLLALALLGTACSAQDIYQARLTFGLPSDSAGRSLDPSVKAIEEAAEHFGLEPDRLFALAACESGMNPEAQNSAGARGLFQQMKQYWPDRVADYNAANPDFPLPNDDIFDPVSNARVSAWMIATIGTRPWQCWPCYDSPGRAKAGIKNCNRGIWQPRVIGL